LKSFGVALSCVYALGIVAVQIHLLRFGILDITAIDVYYFLVGAWVLMSLLPCAALLLFIEFFLFGHRSVYAKTVSIGLAVGLFCFIIGLIQYRAHQYVLNFNSYPYPKWYVYWNIIGVNLTLLLIWLIIVRVRNTGCPPSRARSVGLGLSMFAVFVFAVFFGRTIYPALDRGVGGGAPQFARLSLSENGQKPVMLVHVSDSYVYFMELSAFPADLESRGPSRQYATDRSGPVYHALARNFVTRISNDKIYRLDIIGFNQRAIIERYLFEGRYFFWM
jgi:hypothetical protein